MHKHSPALTRNWRRLAALPVAGLAICAFVTACTTDDLLQPTPLVDVGTSTASLRPPEPVPDPQIPQSAPAQAISGPVEQSAPVSVGYVPRISLPAMTAPDRPDQMPRHEIECRKALASWGATFRDIAPVDDGGGCAIAHPVSLSGAGGGIAIAPAATLTCDMALAFTEWARNDLAPAARLRYFSGVGTIHQGSSYSCRTIGGVPGGTLSEHASGNALDVMAITLKDGRYIDVHKPGLFSFRERSFLNAVRADACGYFSTVLGPGYNYDHRNHFHFDLMQRSSGHRACR